MDKRLRRRLFGYGLIWASGPMLAALADAGCGDGDSTSTGASTVASSTGSGGAGGQGGQAGAGGCLDASDYFSIVDPGFCVVAIYEAEEAFDFSSVPTWGSHGGPLTRREGVNGTVHLVRWMVPPANTGTLTKMETPVPSVNPPNSILGAQALDLPFFGWTALSWSGTTPNTQGEIVLVKNDTTVDKRYAVNGAVSLATVPAAMGQGRLLYSALSKIADPTTSQAGLYAADSCGTTAMASLLPGTDPTCSAPLAIHLEDESPGPVQMDADGNTFVLSFFAAGDNLSVRGFAAPLIQRGAPPSAGNGLYYTLAPKFSLAAIAPQGTAPGLLMWQFGGWSSDMPEQFNAGDLYAYKYRVMGEQLTVELSDTTYYWITFADVHPRVFLILDDMKRIWMGIPGPTKTGFFVLARRPPQ